MGKTIARMMVAALVSAVGAVWALGGGDFTITVVNPDSNKPVVNQQIRVSPKGEKSRVVRTDENGKMTLPGTFMGKSAAIRCSSVPLLFDTRQTLESGMTVVLKHRCGEKKNWTR